MISKHTSKIYDDDILIVDDEIPNLQLLNELLGSEGYRVRPAERPQLAIESALAKPPGLILLDVRMPEMDGFEVCRQLKQDERTRGIPIIFVSALQDTQDRVQGFEAGGVDFISKPFQEMEVLARVRTHMSLRSMQLQLEERVAERTAELQSEILVRKQAEKELKNYQQRLKALASQLTLAEEKERRRIATDLHDHIGQTLAFSRIQVARARKLAPEGKLADILDELSKSLLTTIQGTKGLVFDLSSPLLNELGLTAALSNWLEERVEKQHDIRIKFIDDGKKAVISDDLRAILFRNVRELLSNVIRHAQASNVVVMLERVPEALTISVQDDGVGFKPDLNDTAVTDGNRFGLFSIRERMADFGGSLKIFSKPDNGCQAILSVPLGNDTIEEGA
jgi:signal transduction histidine kinase